jgi:uncharacterized protein YkwD
MNRRPAVRGDNAALNAAAQVRAREAAQYWSHTRPDGRHWSTALAEHNVSFRSGGENLAWASGVSGGLAGNSPTRVVRIWMNSPGHRDNLLGPHTHVGIGMYFCSTTGRYFWAQLFINDGSYNGSTWNFWVSLTAIALNFLRFFRVI